MSEESIPNLRRSIETMKAKKKKLQDMYTDDGEQLRYFEEKETQIQEFIRDLNNKNKELQREIEARQAAQSTRNSFFDKQHQEILEKLYAQHQRLLEQKADLLAKEKKGPIELQQLEEKYSKLLKDKQDILMRQQQILQQEEKQYREAVDRQSMQISQIVSLQNTYQIDDYEEEDYNDLDTSDDIKDNRPIQPMPQPNKPFVDVPGFEDIENDLHDILGDFQITKITKDECGLPQISTADFRFPTFMDYEDDDSFADDDDLFSNAMEFHFPDHFEKAEKKHEKDWKQQKPKHPLIQTKNQSLSIRSKPPEPTSQNKEETEKLIECFRKQIAMMEKKTSLSTQIKALEQMRLRFESEIQQLKAEQNKQNNPTT